MEQEPWTLMTGLQPHRKARKMTQEQLAARLGTTDRTIKRWERGDCLPDLPTLFFLCDILDVAPIDLIPSLRFAPQQLTRHQEATA